MDKLPFKKGFAFGLTSGVITTLGLIIGLASSTNSSLAVISGILTIAIADALSDALGIHISTETENKSTPAQIWQATGATFVSKLIFASSFLIPFLFFPHNLAIFINICWGMLLLSCFSCYLARLENLKIKNVIFEHLSIALLVIILTYYLGLTIKKLFA